MTSMQATHAGLTGFNEPGNSIELVMFPSHVFPEIRILFFAPLLSVSKVAVRLMFVL